MNNFLGSIRKYKSFQILVALAISLSVIFSLGWYFYRSANSIALYNNAVDCNFINKLFKENWYWLVAGNSDFNQTYVKNIFDRKSPTGDIKSAGSLSVYTYKDNNQPVGMVAFYKHKVYEGAILFLGVDKEYRGHGYARKLLKFALDKLKSQGVSIVRILTRTNNKPALNLYKSLGFKEVWSDKDYIKLNIEI